MPSANPRHSAARNGRLTRRFDMSSRGLEQSADVFGAIFAMTTIVWALSYPAGFGEQGILLAVFTGMAAMGLFAFVFKRLQDMHRQVEGVRKEHKELITLVIEDAGKCDRINFALLLLGGFLLAITPPLVAGPFAGKPFPPTDVVMFVAVVIAFPVSYWLSRLRFIMQLSPKTLAAGGRWRG